MLVLASNSSIRAQLLKNAGVAFSVHPAHVDEESLIASLVAENESPRAISDVLAEYKARQVSGVADGYILGTDQTLECDGQLYQKVTTREDAHVILTQLQGRAHKLHSAAVLYENANPVWRIVRTATLEMRSLSDDDIDQYLSKACPDCLNSVGCYQLENIGVNLFHRIDGDYFTILGLPLLDILGFLRLRGLIT